MATHPVTLAALGEARTAAPGTRLELAIARWDIQAHRTLAAQPTPPDLVRVARTQALIAATALIVTSAAADQGKVDSGTVQRLSPTLEAAQIAWTLTANLWSNVKSPTGRTDPNLIRAASDIRTAIAATAHTPTGWASPQRLAEQVDLAKTVRVLQLGMVASVDVAHVMREVAAVGLAATAPQEPMTLAARGVTGQATIITELTRESRIAASGAEGSSTTLTAMAADHRRRGLVNQADVVIATTSSAVSVTASLSPVESKPTHQSESTRRPTELRAEERVVPDRPFPTKSRR